MPFSYCKRSFLVESHTRTEPLPETLSESLTSIYDKSHLPSHSETVTPWISASQPAPAVCISGFCTFFCHVYCCCRSDVITPEKYVRRLNQETRWKHKSISEVLQVHSSICLNVPIIHTPYLLWSTRFVYLLYWSFIPSPNPPPILTTVVLRSTVLRAWPATRSFWSVLTNKLQRVAKGSASRWASGSHKSCLSYLPQTAHLITAP